MLTQNLSPKQLKTKNRDKKIQDGLKISGKEENIWKQKIIGNNKGRHTVIYKQQIQQLFDGR